ncbi:hypothetical protein S420910_117 [Synechococcus phage S-CAM7]|uniref:Uncharacterized protein n=1 Tax=Synechococcus phage S-CAM7 TaxID=1883368 RepID=A0A1D8KUI8_9CAUD|nr:hypothetical protein S420910_117 [Synechococcus phage S-CAM7]
MTPSIFIDTENSSTAVDAIVLTPRRVQFAWASGSVSAHTVRLRDQVRFYIRHLMLDEELSYGAWSNWVLDNQIL